MGGDKRFGSMRRGKSHGLIFAFACVALLAGGCSKSEPEKADNGATFDSSRLPRVSGAKEVFASPATTIFTSPDSVAQTADTLDKALAAAGWQKYVAPNTAYSQDPKMRTMSLKKRHASVERVHHDRAGAEQRHQRAIRRVAAQNRSAVHQGRQRHRVLAGPAATDSGHRGAGRQDAGLLSQGAWRARLGAVVRKDQRKATGRRAFRRRARARRPMPITSTTKSRRSTLVLTVQYADAGKIQSRTEGVADRDSGNRVAATAPIPARRSTSAACRASKAPRKTLPTRHRLA